MITAAELFARSPIARAMLARQRTHGTGALVLAPAVEVATAVANTATKRKPKWPETEPLRPNWHIHSSSSRMRQGMGR